MEHHATSIAVLGGGASGMFAAIGAAREARRCGKKPVITVYERDDRLGKKLLVTGNGRCNLSNENVGRENYFGATALFEKIYQEWNSKQTLSVFSEFGLQTVSDGAGRIYPKSMKASSVLDALLFACEQYGIRTVTNTEIFSVKKQKNGYLINDLYAADAVILAAGGKAGAAGNRNESLYAYLKQAGIRVTPLRPALTAFTVRSFPKSLKGIRAAGKITLLQKEKAIATEQGELQYTEYGLSGIPAMQLSSCAARLPEGEPLQISADSAPDIPYQTLKEQLEDLKKRLPEMPVLLFLSGLMPKQLGAYFLKEAGLGQQTRLRELGPKDLRGLLEQIKQKRYDIQGLRPFSQAQVTSGGIAPEELNGSLMLKKCPGMYACGEIIDINGDCGGYNLQWAWTSGYIAVRNSVRESI